MVVGSEALCPVLLAAFAPALQIVTVPFLRLRNDADNPAITPHCLTERDECPGGLSMACPLHSRGRSPRSRVDHDRFVAVPPIGRGGWNGPVPQTKEKDDDKRN